MPTTPDLVVARFQRWPLRWLFPTLRILAQLVVAGPLLMLFPWAALLGFRIAVSAFGGVWPDTFGKLVSFGLGWIGLLGLWASIVLPLRLFRRSWIRVPVVAALVCGIVATAAILLSGDVLAATVERKDRVAMWWLGGPLVVATWNLLRIFQTLHHHRQQPTPPSASP